MVAIQPVDTAQQVNQEACREVGNIKAPTMFSCSVPACEVLTVKEEPEIAIQLLPQHRQAQYPHQEKVVTKPVYTAQPVQQEEVAIKQGDQHEGVLVRDTTWTLKIIEIL